VLPFLFDYIFGKFSKDQLLNGLGAFVLSIVICLGFGFANMHYRDYVHWNTQDIVAMQDNETMIISRYSTDSKMYYHFMVDNGDHYKSRRVSQNVSTIRYTDGKPKLEIYKKESTNKFVYFFMPIREYVNDYKYDFYVPKGTIKEEFNVDLN